MYEKKSIIIFLGLVVQSLAHIFFNGLRKSVLTFLTCSGFLWNGKITNVI